MGLPLGGDALGRQRRPEDVVDSLGQAATLYGRRSAERLIVLCLEFVLISVHCRLLSLSAAPAPTVRWHLSAGVGVIRMVMSSVRQFE